MVDLLPTLAEWLKPVGRVEVQFPAANDRMPVITLLEIASASSVILDSRERLSTHSFQVDVWDNGKNRKRCEEIAAQVNAVLLERGLSRSLAQSVEDPNGLHRKMMQFDCELDEQTLYIHRR
jgi:hypothetical protein